MILHAVLCFLLGSTIVVISTSSDDMNEVNSAYPSNNSVHWIVETNPVIFGHHVTLFCITINVECFKCPTRWYGGKGLPLLSYNGYPSKNKRYVPSTGRGGFGIVITQFGWKDLNVNYSCSFGPYFDKKNLTEDMLHVKYEPEDGYSPEQLKKNWIAGVIVLTVGVCLVTCLLVIIKIRQHKASREHKSDGNNFSKNISNSAYAKCNLMTANNPTESNQNSKDLQICSSDSLLFQESV